MCPLLNAEKAIETLGYYSVAEKPQIKVSHVGNRMHICASWALEH